MCLGLLSDSPLGDAIDGFLWIKLLDYEREVRKDAMKVVNTQTFINLPISKMHDINISTLLEIVHK